MAIERSTVVGVFKDRSDADRAVEELHRMGFRDDQIGFMMRGGESGLVDSIDDNNNRAGEAATGGIVTGGVIGGALAAASLLIPGIGPVLAGGILATVIGGAAAGGAIGGLLGMFTGMGIPDDEARYYEGEFNQGRILVTVSAGSRYREVRDLLRSRGAYDIEGGPSTGTVGAGVRSWTDMSPEYRQRWQTRYGTSGGRFEDYEPYYRYGYEMSSDPRYQNREWNDVESDLNRDYGTWARTHGYGADENAWERFKGSVQDSWDSARGRRRAA
jgi:hypothetical protein